MGCYTFYIFNRKGACQYYHEWSRPKPVRQGPGSQAEDFKLMFGLLWSMKAFAAAVDPKSETKQRVGAPTMIGDGCTFSAFRTSAYKLHFLESPSGLKFVLITDPTVGGLAEHLNHIYSALFVELVAKNPLYNPADAFLFEPFSSALNKYMRTLGLLA